MNGSPAIDGMIINCVNHGNIVATGTNSAGICVTNFKTVLNCVNTGSVTATTTASGICDIAGNNYTVTLCFNCGLHNGSSGYAITGGNNAKDCWYLKVIDGTTFDQIGTNMTAVENGANSEELLAAINAKVEEYRATYPELCSWIIDNNGLPTVNLCAEEETPSEGSTLSDGNLWIVLAVAALAICAIAVLFVVRKKKTASHRS